MLENIKSLILHYTNIRAINSEITAFAYKKLPQITMIKANNKC